VKSFIRFTLGVLFVGITLFPARAAFTSLYIFGDTLSATTDPDTAGSSYYYGGRDSNGRAWVEVLAQRQGLKSDGIKNNSYWDHNSSNLVTELKTFTPPADVANSLFIVWVCNADTFDAATTLLYNPRYQLSSANILSQANHQQIIASLYAKGVRNLVLPNAVDISQIPAFNAGTAAAALHAGCLDYNARFASMISQARATYPGLKIYTPDFFTLLNNALTNAAYYGLTNALSAKGFSIDATTALYSKSQGANLNGPGTNYIFWDPQNPTAKFHAVIADVAQQIISPVQIGQVAVLTGSNRLDLVNVPVGLNGFVEGITATNNASWNWTSVQSFNSTNLAQSVFVTSPQFPPFLVDTNTSGGGSIDPGNPGTGTGSGSHVVQPSQAQIYRLRFPFAWNWP
jgi:phospholipase/lecithinase/hemolysin